MATIILRDAGSITSPGSTAKGSPLTNLEVDNNFSNINITLGVLSNLSTTENANLVVAINKISTIVDEISSASVHYPVLSRNTSGQNTGNVSSTKLTFTPSTGLLTSTDYNSSSDMTLKQDFTPIQNPLDIISQLTGFGFTWKDSKQRSYGLSAQEVEKVIPDIVKDRPDGTKGINYMNLTAFLVEAIKDLRQEIVELKKHK